MSCSNLMTYIFVLLLLANAKGDQSTASNVNYKITTLLGGFNGDGQNALTVGMFWPQTIAISSTTGNIYYSDYLNNQIRYIKPDGNSYFLAGNPNYNFDSTNFPKGPTPATTSIHWPFCVAVNSKGEVYFTDENTLRKVYKNSYGQDTMLLLAGGGSNLSSNISALDAKLGAPFGLLVDEANDVIYVSDTYKYTIRKIVNGTIYTIAGTGVEDKNTPEGSLAASASIAKVLTLTFHPLTRELIYLEETGRVRRITNEGRIFTLYSGTNGAIGMVFDSFGDFYLAESTHQIVKISNSVRTVVANDAGVAAFGGDGGLAINATLNNPTGLAISGRFLYVADTSNFRIRRIDLDTKIITTLAGNGLRKYMGIVGSSVALYRPRGTFYNSQTDELLIADWGNSRVIRLNSLSNYTSSKIEPILGTGNRAYSADGNFGNETDVIYPRSVVQSLSNGDIYVGSENLVMKLRKSDQRAVTIAGTRTTLAGDGYQGIYSQLSQPRGVCVGPTGDIYIVDAGNYVIRKIDSNGIISTFIGDGVSGYRDGDALTARIGFASAITCLSNGDLLISDSISDGMLFFGNYLNNQRIRKFTAKTNQVTTVAGTGVRSYSGDGGPAIIAPLNGPTGVYYNETNGDIIFCDSENYRIRKISNSTGLITTIAGTGVYSYNGDGLAALATNIAPFGISVHPITDEIYFSDMNSFMVRKIDSKGLIKTVIGYIPGCTGFSTTSYANKTCLNFPSQIIFSPNGDLFVAVYLDHIIKKMNYGSDVVYNVAGTGAKGVVQPPFSGDLEATSTNLNHPFGVAFSPFTNELIFSDTDFYRVRKVTPFGFVKTIAGGIGDNGLAVNAYVGFVRALALTDNEIYLSDSFYRIRKVSFSSGIITTFAGNYNYVEMEDNVPTNYTSLDIYDMKIRNNELVFSDRCSILKTNISGTGILTRVAGKKECGYVIDSMLLNQTTFSTNTTFGYSISFTYMSNGEMLIADTNNNVIRKVDLNGYSTIIAGNGTAGFNGDSDAKQAYLNNPQGLSVLSDGRIIFSDSGNDRIRMLSPYCKEEYYILTQSPEGLVCNLTSCFGKLSNDPNVCSGNGKCIGIDTCKCHEGVKFVGNECREERSLEIIGKPAGFVKGTSNSFYMSIVSVILKKGDFESIINSNNCTNCTWTNLKYSWKISDGNQTSFYVPESLIAYYHGKVSNGLFKLSFRPILSLKGTTSSLQGNVTLSVKFHNSMNITESVEFVESFPLISPPQRIHSNATILPQSGMALSSLFTIQEDLNNWIVPDPILGNLEFSFGFEFINSFGENSLIRLSEFSTNSSLTTYLPFIQNNRTNDMSFSSINLYVICRDSLFNEYPEFIGSVKVIPNSEDLNDLILRIRLNNVLANIVPYDQSANQNTDILYESIRSINIQFENPSLTLSVINQLTSSSLETKSAYIVSSKLDEYLSKVYEQVRIEKNSNGFISKQRMSDTDLFNTLSTTSNILLNGYVNISNICNQLSSIILSQQNAKVYSDSMVPNSYISHLINITTTSFFKTSNTGTISQIYNDVSFATDYILSKYDGYYSEIGLSLITFDENLYINGNSTQLTKSKEFTMYKSGSQISLSDLRDPIYITFTIDTNSSISNSSLLSCQFWNETNQRWESHGCSIFSFNNKTNQLICQCNHATLFAAFIEQETPSSTEYLRQISSLYIAQISFGSLFLLLSLTILTLLVTFRKSILVRSRFITPYIGITALIIECSMLLITQRGILLGYANSVIGNQQDFEQSQSTVIQLQNGDLVANIISNIFTIIVNTMTLTAFFSYLYQVVRFQVLKYFYHQIYIMFHSKEPKGETILKLTKLFLSTRVMLILMCLFISLNVIYWVLWVILIRVGVITSLTYTHIVSISFTCSILLLGFITCCIIGLELIMTCVSKRKEREIIQQGQENNEKTNLNFSLNDLITGKSLEKFENFTATKKALRMPLYGIREAFTRLDSPLYFRAEMCLFVMCFTCLVISQIIGLSGLSFRKENSLKMLLLNDSISLLFDILYMFSYLFVFGGYSLVILIIQKFKKKQLEKQDDDDDIRKLIEHSEGLKLFEWFCEKEYSLENLQLYLELRNNQNILESLNDFQQVKTVINHIYVTYIQMGALKEVNISSDCSKLFASLVKRLDSVDNLNVELESAENMGSKKTMNFPQGLKESITESIESLQNQIRFNLSDTLSRFIFTQQFKTYQEIVNYKENLLKQAKLEI
ncbi:predicted protein [Naegleria gruberi]|uniref:Predicted protein n=1 Tax=Naegleria gruberi TaxID=5762 RepID=D2V3Y0_NAEGR|nr:uncharacterized protein NAEGRDRAFT_63528 [Naegleria gruberi]EFC48428.1 predicted protein [Naegleria gruberi]|eukprot:XP_002681172.1 predicted protein [Naegleria gruberi strain NEG-M]